MKCGSSVGASRENYGFAEILVILDPIKVAQDDDADRRKAGEVMLRGHPAAPAKKIFEEL